MNCAATQLCKHTITIWKLASRFNIYHKRIYDICILCKIFSTRQCTTQFFIIYVSTSLSAWLRFTFMKQTNPQPCRYVKQKLIFNQFSMNNFALVDAELLQRALFCEEGSLKMLLCTNFPSISCKQVFSYYSQLLQQCCPSKHLLPRPGMLHSSLLCTDVKTSVRRNTSFGLIQHQDFKCHLDMFLTFFLIYNLNIFMLACEIPVIYRVGNSSPLLIQIIG